MHSSQTIDFKAFEEVRHSLRVNEALQNGRFSNEKKRLTSIY